MLRGDRDASKRREIDAGARGVDREHARADHEDPEVEQDERRDAERSALSSTTRPLRRTGRTISAVQRSARSRAAASLNSSRWRTTLTEPPVEPAEPPKNIRQSERHQSRARPGVVVGDREAGRRHGSRSACEDASAGRRLAAGEPSAGPDLGHDERPRRSASRAKYSRSSSSRADRARRRRTKHAVQAQRS